MRLWRRARLHAFPELEARLGHTLEGDRRFVREILPARTALWVAEADGRALGFLAIAGDFIDQLFVDPDHQGRGAGSALIAHAKMLSPVGLRLFTFQSNARARAFYEKRGFVAARFGVSPAPESEPDVEYRWTPG